MTTSEDDLDRKKILGFSFAILDHVGDQRRASSGAPGNPESSPDKAPSPLAPWGLIVPESVIHATDVIVPENVSPAFGAAVPSAAASRQEIERSSDASTVSGTGGTGSVSDGARSIAESAPIHVQAKLLALAPAATMASQGSPAGPQSNVATPVPAKAEAAPAAAPPAGPSGSGSEITFVSGITSGGQVAGTSFWSWDYASNPATYDSSSNASKWGSSTPGTSGGTVKYWFDANSNWSTTEKNGLASGLSLWSAEANIKFALASSAGSADLVFYRASDGTASTSPPGDSNSVGSNTEGTLGSVSISIDPSGGGFGPIGGAFSLSGGYPYQTLVHEEGHMIGLGHGGPYNAGDGAGSVPSRQFGVYDSRLWTLMSYINPTDSSASYYNSYPVKGTSWAGNNPTTPMILDILAAQRLYGAATSGPLASGGQVFGFNCNIAGSNTDSSLHRYFDFTNNKSPVVTLWDGGTGNTLDLSGYSANATISLQPGTFSSCDGMVNDIGIAEGTVIETADGGSGSDVLTGSDADNFLYGNGGNDTLQGGAGDDYLNGGTGTNTASYSTSPNPVIVNLAGGTGSGGDADGDTLVNIQNVTGSNYADILIGDSNANALLGGGGDDLLKGGGGADRLDGGTGNNTASYINSSTAVSVSLATGTGAGGEAQGDTLVNIQNLTGSDYNDVLTGNGSANGLSGGKGNDTLQGYGGADKLDGGDGTNTASYTGAGSAVIVNLASGTGSLGDAQGDTLTNIQNLTGSGYGDILTGDGNVNVLSGGGGDDILKGGGGADALDGGSGSNTATYAGSTAGVIVNLASGTGSGGDAQGDTLTNIQNLTGSGQNDVLTGDGNANGLSGGDGNDTLKGGGGADHLDGGTGTNIASYLTSAAGVTVNLATGTGSGGDAQGDTLVNMQTVLGSNEDDTLVGDGNANTLYGEDGSDLLKGGGGADILNGGGGTNAVSYLSSSAGVTVDLDDGTGSGGDAQGDTLVDIQTVYGSEEGDLLEGDDNANTLYGEDDDDTLKGGGGADYLDGGTGNNTASYLFATIGVSVSLASGTGSAGDAQGDTLVDIQNLTGSNDDDTLVGDGNANLIYGEDGNDLLQGGGGGDTLNGGTGFDTALFTFASTAAAITTSGGSPTNVTQGSDSTTLSAIEDLTFTDLSIVYAALTIPSGQTAYNIEVAASGSLENDGALVFNTTTPIIEAGPISGSGTVTVAVGGNVTFNSAGTYTGATSVQGSLAIGSGGSLSGTSLIALTASGAVFDVSGAGVATIARLSTVTGTTVSLGSSSLALTGSASLSGGTLTATSGGSLSTAGTTTTSGVVLGGSTKWTNSGTVTQTGTVQIGDSSGSIANLANLAAGSWRLAGDVGFTIGSNTGSNLSNAGTLAKTSGSGISHVAASTADTGTLSVASGTLEFDGLLNSVAGALVGPGTVQLASGTTDTLGTLVVTGGATLSNSGAVTQTGLVTMTSGTLSNAAGSSWSMAPGSAVTLASGGTGGFINAGTLTKAAGGPAKIGVNVTDTGSVKVTGGLLTFSGPSSTYAGAFTGAGTVSFGGGANALNAGTSIGTNGWTITGSSTSATLNTALAYGGAFTLSGGATLALLQALTLSGTASVAAAKINGSAGLTTNGTTSVNGATLGGTVTWTNSGTVTAAGALTLGDSAQTATFTNASAAAYNITGLGGIALGGGATTSVFNNIGLLTRSVGVSTVNIGAKLVDTGTVSVATGGLEFDGAGSTFAGAINGAGIAAFGSSVGATLLAGSSLAVGTVSIVAGGRLNLGTSLTYAGKFLQAATGVLGLGNRTLTLTGTATVAGTAVGAGGTLAVSAGALALNTGAALSMSSLTLANGALLTANAALIVQANLAETASTLTLNQNNLIFAHDASFSGGMIDGAGSGTVAVKGTATLANGLTLDGNATLALYGTANETGGLTLGDGSGGTAILLNALGATFTIGDNSSVLAASGGTGKVANAGTLIKSGTSGTSLIGTAVSNTGTIAVATGTLNLAGGVVGTGTLTIGSGATLELGGVTASASTVSFASGGSAETLQLDKAQAFAGTVSGFGTGDTMDLANIAFSGATLSYVDTTSGGVHSGTLKVQSGGTTANLHLLGTYTLANFTPAAPDSGAQPGTLITVHA